MPDPSDQPNASPVAQARATAAPGVSAKFVTGSILRHILVMTSTGAIGLIAIFAGDLANILFLSLLGDVEVVAAVGYSSSLLFVTIAMSIGMSIATVSLVSPALGAGDVALARRLSASAHVFTLIASGLMALLFMPVMPWLLRLMGAHGRTASLAFDYLAILLPALPALALAMTSSAVLRSAGDAKRAMYITLGAAIVNVALDPVLIFGLGLGLHGAAIATAISRVVIMLIGLYAVARVHGLIERPTLAHCRADAGPVLALAIPAVATNVATPVANAIVTAAFAPFGDSAVAGWAVIGRLQPVAFGFVFAMSGSVGPIIGQNLGAGRPERMREAFTMALAVTALYTLLAWALLALSGPMIVRIFNATGDGAGLILAYCGWLAPVFGFQGAMFVTNAVFNTLRQPHIATVLNWGRAILGTLPFTAAGAALFGAPGVLAGNLVGGVLFGAASVWLCYKMMARLSAGQRAQPWALLWPQPGADRSDSVGTPPTARSMGSVGHLVAIVILDIVRAVRKLATWAASRATRRAGMITASGMGLLQRLQAKAELARWRRWLIELPRPWKRVILAINDFILLSLAVWLALSLRYNELFVPPGLGGLLMMLAAPATGVATFARFGLYRLVTRYITVRGSGRLLMCIGLSVLIWAALVLVFEAPWIPRSVILVLYPLLAGAAIFGSRQVFAVTLRTVGVPIPQVGQEPRPVVIYGAGPTGMQLLDALHSTGEARVVGFLDDTASLWGQYAGGAKIYRPDKLQRLIEREHVKEVILAIPESRRHERRQILKRLEPFPVRVKTLPAMEDFASGRATVADLRPVDVDDLLGRDPVPADGELLARGINGHSVMVTGAGGSIGSELVRQLLRHAPSHLVLLDLSEVALHEIEIEVADAVAALPVGATRPIVVAVLGSVLNRELIRRTIKTYNIATIYHAAAYKHVPIVERNPVAGLDNNTFGTAIVAEAARELGVERVVLISTDKAVRPTNIMGASKRLAELILQAHAADPKCASAFTMVRFGNVLDSSGSVVRRFRKQILDGGPVTVTDPAIVRYFMSIPEAASLVLQAGTMATGGEVFVLDMGEPVKIDELARSMIRLMGLEVRDEAHPDGDIQITYIGLRPGEKLYEELLIGANTTPTEHPLIRRSNEPLIARDRLERELAVLKAAMDAGNLAAIEAVLLRTVEEYDVHFGTDGGEAPAVPFGAPSRMLH